MRDVPEDKLVLDDESVEFLMTYYDFSLANAQMTMASEYRACTLELDFAPVAGVRVALAKVWYYGSAVLEKGVAADILTNVGIDTEPMSSPPQRTSMQGPYDESFQVPHQPRDLAWSPCGASRTLKASARIGLHRSEDDNRTGSNFEMKYLRTNWSGRTDAAESGAKFVLLAEQC